MTSIYHLMAPTGGAMMALSGSSVDAQIYAAEVVVQAVGGDTAQASELSIEQIDPKSPGWTRRVRIGACRKPCPNRISPMEKSTCGFAENPGDNVIAPRLGTGFDTLGEAYDFYNPYSWINIITQQKNCELFSTNVSSKDFLTENSGSSGCLHVRYGDSASSSWSA